MDAINRNIQVLLSVIKRSEVYKEYKKQEANLERNPELKARVDQFRADNFRLQNESDRENLFSVAELLAKESSQLRKMPEVNAYLDAELALCKMMQKICRSLTEGIEIHVPDL
ncbi:MAG: YlbF family regulator [Eubacteriales bacterium]|nr:YlbF family regulator [Eubacteriales bacterium]